MVQAQYNQDEGKTETTVTSCILNLKSLILEVRVQSFIAYELYNNYSFTIMNIIVLQNGWSIQIWSHFLVGVLAASQNCCTPAWLLYPRRLQTVRMKIINFWTMAHEVTQTKQRIHNDLYLLTPFDRRSFFHRLVWVRKAFWSRHGSNWPATRWGCLIRR